MPSVAMRKPGPKKRGSRIGFLIDPFRRRAIWFESKLEEEWATVLIARPDVLDIREQQTVTYGTANQRHTFDFVVTWESGGHTAYAVKYAADVKEDLRQVLARIADASGDQVAEDYRILTERGLHPTTIANARLILSCSADFDYAGRVRVREYLRDAGSHVMLGEIGRETGLGLRGFRAAVSLFHERALSAPSGQRLSPDAVVENRLSGSVPSLAAT